ncbi:MAG: ElyC/SanA/YdcF family protein [Candidatus Riflemargulisbacteria bacterium]
MNTKLVAIDEHKKIDDLRQVLSRLANASIGEIPLDAKAIIIFGCPHTEAPEKAIEVIIKNRLEMPVIFAGDGRKDGVGLTEAEKYFDLFKKKLPYGMFRQIRFCLDKDSTTTPENAQNVKKIIEDVGLSVKDKILFFNFPTIALQAQRELEKHGFSDVFTVVPEISDAKVLLIEGWINFKKGQILGE